MQVKLISEKGIDYTQLHGLLTARKWKEADQETARVMRLAADKKESDWLGSEDIQKIPCADLQKINQLWLRSSNRRFGFSVQRCVYQEEAEDFGNLGKRLGWKKRNGDWVKTPDVQWTIDAPEGHLPMGGSVVNKLRGEWLWGIEDLSNLLPVITSSSSNYSALMQKLANCNI